MHLPKFNFLSQFKNFSHRLLRVPDPAAPFSVNFVRQTFVPFAARSLFAYIVTGYCAICLAVLLFQGLIWAGLNLKSNQLENQFRRQFNGGAKSRHLIAQMDDLHAKASKNLSELHGLISLHEERYRTSDKLAGIARTIPARTWITKLETQEAARSLSIYAEYLIEPDNPYHFPTENWMKALREDPDFGKGLTALTLMQSTQKDAGSTQVYLFEFYAQWQGAAS